MTTALSVVLFTSSCFLAACGGAGGGGSDSRPTVGEGRFVDSAVAGLEYRSGTISGVTDGDGRFRYEVGQPVTFTIGGIELPVLSAGRAVVTPVDLVSGAIDERDPTVTNIVRFLLTLDDDADPTNGIQITDVMREAAARLAVSFDVPPEAFAEGPAVQSALIQLTRLRAVGEGTLVTTQVAREHFRGTLFELLEGRWTGTYSGGDQGSWSLSVDLFGRISGTATSSLFSETYRLTGTIASSGEASLVFGSVSTGATFEGSFGRDGQASGTWQNAFEGLTGTFAGSRQ